MISKHAFNSTWNINHRRGKEAKKTHKTPPFTVFLFFCFAFVCFVFVHSVCCSARVATVAQPSQKRISRDSADDRFVENMSYMCRHFRKKRSRSIYSVSCHMCSSLSLNSGFLLWSPALITLMMPSLIHCVYDSSMFVIALIRIFF